MWFFSGTLFTVPLWEKVHCSHAVHSSYPTNRSRLLQKHLILTRRDPLSHPCQTDLASKTSWLWSYPDISILNIFFSIKHHKSCSILNILFDSALWTAQKGCVEHWPTCVGHHIQLTRLFVPKHERASSSTLRPDKTGDRNIDYVNILYKNAHSPPRERMNWMVGLWIRDEDGFR